MTFPSRGTRVLRGHASLSIRVMCAALPALLVSTVQAGTVRGVVLDPLGARIANASVTVACDATPPATVQASGTGEFSVSLAAASRCTVSASAPGFAVASLPGVFVPKNATVAQEITLAVAPLTSTITITDTGVPTSQAQDSASITVLQPEDFAEHALAVDPLRLVPGVTVTQTGQYGGATSLFVRGGDSTANKVLINGVEAEDVGGRFDLSNVSSTGLDTVEVHRGADSVIYGADALASVIVMNPPQGRGATPLLTVGADAGNFNTRHVRSTLSGAAGRWDYFGGFSVLNSSNALPMDEYHNISGTANLGFSIAKGISLRAIATTQTSATGVPNAFDFYGVADNAKQGDQDIFGTVTLDAQTTDRWHNLFRAGIARKREQYTQFTLEGEYQPDLGVTLGLPVTIYGANGTSVSGQAILDYGCSGASGQPCSANQNVSNRDLVQYESDYRFSPHLIGLFGFRYQDERGSDVTAYSDETAERHNYDYSVQFSGDVKNRLFYSVGGGIQRNQVFGTEGTPRAGLGYYVVRPGPGLFEGTKLTFNFARGVQEASIDAQTNSLAALLSTLPGGAALAQQYGIGPVGAERVRSYDGGVEQSLFGQRAILRVKYFHNEFGREAEYVATPVLAALGISQSLVNTLNADGVYGAYVNSLSYRAMGAEAELEYQPLTHLFVRAGYTYLDAVVQDSFTSDALCDNPAYGFGCTTSSFPNTAIGAYDPLIGARPFRRPPHTGFFSVTYTRPRWYASLTGNLVSRADDSTFLSDANYGNSLLLPNRNLDPSYQKLDLGVGYQLTSRIAAYTQVDNLLNEQHAGVIGYPALPLSARGGLKLTLGGPQPGK